MPVKIIIIDGLKGAYSPEYEAAQQIKEQFERDFKNIPGANGKITIYSSLSIHNQKRRDIDLLLIGEFSSCLIKNLKVWMEESHVVQSRIVDVDVQNFCFVIELKDLPVDRIRSEGQDLYGKYDGNFGYNISKQSVEQLYSLKNFLERQGVLAPFICNFLWLRSITREDLNNIWSSDDHFFFTNTFSFRDMISRSTQKRRPWKKSQLDNFYTLDFNISDSNSIRGTLGLFSQIKEAQGELTRIKLERITYELIDDENEKKLSEELGKRLTVLVGKAGTGKTIRLLNVAYNLVTKYGKRCLFLTYNHALVGDVNRTLDFIDMDDRDMFERKMRVSTVDSFFVKIMLHYGIKEKQNFDLDYNKAYSEGISVLYDWVCKSAVIDSKEIEQLKEDFFQDFYWNYIFVDEGQDWNDFEKQILFKFYGLDRIMVADGIDQFMKSQKRQDWTDNLKEEKFNYNNIGNTCLRQKSSLVRFVNIFANTMNLKWKLKPNNEFAGGRVIITSAYTPNLHKELFKDCIDQKNAAYDFLFLTPPNYVNSEGFTLYEPYQANGIKLFDGTKEENKSSYSIHKDECRIYQYDSCRGIEGWTVVCLSFDKLIEYKANFFRNKYPQLNDEQINKMLYTWCLMPLTRAIDTLVIEIEDMNSQIGKILRTLSNEYNDIIEKR